jgi:hypothetical protein
VQRTGVGLDDPSPATVSLREAGDAERRPPGEDLGVAKLVRDVEYQIADPSLEGDEGRSLGLASRRRLPALLLQRAHRDDERAVLPLRLDELRNTGANGERVRVASEDPAEEGARDSLRDIAPETTGDEGADALVVVLLPAAGGDDEVEPGAKLRVPAEELAVDEWLHLGRDPENHAFRQGIEAALPDDVDPPGVRSRPDELVAEPDIPRESTRLRLRRDPRVGSGIDDEAVVPDRDEVSPEVGPRLDDPDLAPLDPFLERMGSREPGDSSSDDDDSLHPSFRAMTSRASAARASISPAAAFSEVLRTSTIPSSSAHALASISRS